VPPPFHFTSPFSLLHHKLPSPSVLPANMLVRLTVLACLALVSAHPVEDVVRERQTNRESEAHKTRPRRSTASDLPNIDHCDYQPATTGTVFSNVDSVSIVGVSEACHAQTRPCTD
jgi:hypothetical protein